MAKELVDSELQQWHRRNTADQRWPINLWKWRHFQRCKMHRIFKSWVIPTHPINTCDSTAKIRIQISRSSAIYGLGWKAKWPQPKNRKGPTKTLNLKIPDYWIIEFEGTRQRRSRRMIRKTLKLRQQTGGHELSSGPSRINPHSVPVWVTKKNLRFDHAWPNNWKSSKVEVTVHERHQFFYWSNLNKLRIRILFFLSSSSIDVTAPASERSFTGYMQ